MIFVDKITLIRKKKILFGQKERFAVSTFLLKKTKKANMYCNSDRETILYSDVLKT